MGRLHEHRCTFMVNILLSSSWNEKCFTEMLWRQPKHTFCVQ